MSSLLLFGTFDHLHPGHLALLRQASRHGENIIVSLPSDATVMRLKGHPPRKTFEERSADLLASGLVSRVVQSDEASGEYSVVTDVKPDMIAFGYDQDALRQDFDRWNQSQSIPFKTVTLEAFEPGQYKSSLLSSQTK